MIVYSNTSKGFLTDVSKNQISNIIKDSFFKKTGKKNFNISEENSWINSMQFMGNIIRNSELADDCGVMIEYGLPSTNLRIDFIVSGEDKSGSKNFIIVELKQWKEAQSTPIKDMVLTPYYNGRYSEHPSVQAHNYKQYLSDFNENVYTNAIKPYSCAYLHNYGKRNPEPLTETSYQKYYEDSPIYFQEDQEKLELFIKRHVGFGKGKEILYLIENGNIKPSKQLIQHVVGLFKGNQEFHLLEDQKVAYEVAMHTALNAIKKTVIIINGAPGTGKSVISMSLLGGLLKKDRNTVFVAPNASFREVMLDKLTKGKDTGRVGHLLTGSGRYVGVKKDIFDAIIVDEAHRLKNEKAFMYKGKNQIDDIVNAAKVSVFFVDEDQIIRPEDIGSIKEITRIANAHNAEIIELELTAQFRCSGANGYINWLSDVLMIKDTANFDGWDKDAFEFRIIDNPNELRKIITDKCASGFNSRLLAGYAWEWTAADKGNSNSQVNDVKIPQFKFEMPWNSRQVGTTWAINNEGVNQVGCVHTSQGLEFDYVGVIVGNDLKYNPQTGEFYTEWNEYRDTKGKQGLNKNPEQLSRLVRNIYRILMTRGMKGCFVYFENPDVRNYFQSRLELIGL